MGRVRRWSSWNVRGLCSAEKRREVKEILKKAKVEIIMLQETKLGDNRYSTGELFAKSLKLCHAKVAASRSAGGLLSCWDSDTFNVVDVILDQRFILLIANVPFMSSTVVIGNVYCPNYVADHRDTFSKLSDEISRLGYGCFLGGDFNSTLNPGERKGGADETDSNFWDFAMGLNLLDLPLTNAEFTWFSSRNGGIWSRIDRWLISEDILQELEGINQSAECWGLSDHRAITLEMWAVDFGPKPFRFYNYWMLGDDFNDLVKSWWNSPLVAGWAGASLHERLKSLKNEIKKWKGSKGSGLTERISILEGTLQVIME
ncbi:uncharacterized protein LOC130737106 [Lotus japonicus]|uniref:uncharacterized protein LOC130737106 n=1 Tax=Lotus japonicus TaxID=34305 RepID=UPI002582AEC4|nr:uncharacterized protein LOC130737106 [Lotus japonicus]